MKKITINKDRCVGLHLCGVSCERFFPGIHKHIERHGCLLVNNPHTLESSVNMNRMIARCPNCAMLLSEYDGPPQDLREWPEECIS